MLPSRRNPLPSIPMPIKQTEYARDPGEIANTQAVPLSMDKFTLFPMM